MAEPWGISDPDFLRIYALGFGVTLLFAYAVRILTRAGTPTEFAPGKSGRLTTNELAYLAGGSSRVVEAAVARLIDSGDLRASGDGCVVAAGTSTGYDPITRTVLADVSRFGRRPIRALVEHLRDADAVREIRDRLVRSGLAVDGTARLRIDVGLIPAIGLLVVGLLRWATDIQEARSVAWLTPLLLGSGAVLYFLYRLAVVPRTFVGDEVFADTRTREGRSARPEEAATLVAVGGLDAYPDDTVRAALRSPIGSSRAGLAGGGEAAAGDVAAMSKKDFNWGVVPRDGRKAFD